MDEKHIKINQANAEEKAKISTGKRIIVVPKKPEPENLDTSTKQMMHDMLEILRRETTRLNKAAIKHGLSNAEARILNSHAKSLLDIEKALLEREKFDKFGNLTDEELKEIAREFDSK